MTLGVRGWWLGAGAIGACRVLPVVLVVGLPADGLSHAVAALLALLGIAIWEHLWVEAPQRLPLA